MKFLIISGLSGSGKSIALQALEDMGFYCIDNLPAALLPHFARQIMEGGRDELRNAAVGIDARNHRFLDALTNGLSQLRAIGLGYEIIFLEAEETVLVRRFKATRRKHPLTRQGIALLDGIRQEKILLEPLSVNAALRVDTTHTTPHELRHLVHNFAHSDNTEGMTLMFESFGFKNGTPLDADFVFDVRCLPNPYWEADLRKLTGMDQPVIEFLERDRRVQDMFNQLCGFLETWLPSFEAEHRSYMTIALGCTGGQHRSVYLVSKLAKHFLHKGLNAQIRHRELG
ncbi:MAG: RNase adapter RapZ [Pseudomonadota bacterium]|nr:RNase adapter RapZ [Pseudomonadota bacterium]